MRKILLFCLFVGLTFSCFANEFDFYKGKEFVTGVNMRITKKNVIYSVNYQKGKLLPLGTKVTIKEVSPKRILFTANGQEYVFARSLKYCRVKITELLKRYFKKESEYISLDRRNYSSKQKFAIGQGVLAEGMNKQQVLEALGYPPSHKTKSIDRDLWIYFYDKKKRFFIYFYNDHFLAKSYRELNQYELDRKKDRAVKAIQLKVKMMKDYYSERVVKKEQYIKPQLNVFPKSLKISLPYDKAWEAVVAFFAYNNISIKMIQKDSGLIIASKTIDIADDLEGFIDIGFIEVTENKLKKTHKIPSNVFELNDWDKFLNDDYVIKFGEVIDTELIDTKVTKKQVNVMVSATYNIFVSKQKKSVELSFNSEFKALSEPYEAVSTGLLETLFFNHVKKYMEKS